MKAQSEIPGMLKELSKCDLNASQAHFIHGLRKYYKWKGELSIKQAQVLKSIYEQCFTRVELKYQLEK